MLESYNEDITGSYFLIMNPCCRFYHTIVRIVADYEIFNQQTWLAFQMPICLRQHGAFLLLCIVFSPGGRKNDTQTVKSVIERRETAMPPTPLSAARRIELLEPP